MRSSRSTDRNPASCLGCLGTIVLLMVVSGALVWALNPGMTVEEAARDGILIGGGLGVGLMGLMCLIPLAIIGVIVVAVLFVRRRKKGKKGDAPPEDPDDVVIIDINAEA